MDAPNVETVGGQRNHPPQPPAAPTPLTETAANAAGGDSASVTDPVPPLTGDSGAAEPQTEQEPVPSVEPASGDSTPVIGSVPPLTRDLAAAEPQTEQELVPGVEPASGDSTPVIGPVPPLAGDLAAAELQTGQELVPDVEPVGGDSTPVIGPVSPLTRDLAAAELQTQQEPVPGVEPADGDSTPVIGPIPPLAGDLVATEPQTEQESVPGVEPAGSGSTSVIGPVPPLARDLAAAELQTQQEPVPGVEPAGGDSTPVIGPVPPLAGDLAAAEPQTEQESVIGPVLPLAGDLAAAVPPGEVVAPGTEAAGGQPIIAPAPPPPPATGAGEPQPLSAPAASKLPEPTRQQQAGDAAKETPSPAAHGEGGGKKKLASSRWSRIRPVVWIYTLFRRKSPSPPAPTPSEEDTAARPDAGKVAGADNADLRKEEGKREGSKSGKDGKGKDNQTTVSLEEQAPEPEQGEKKKEKPAEDGATTEDERKKKRWNLVEQRLQKILEDAFTKLLASEFDELNEQWRLCLLTFSFFPVDQRVKKHAVTYWWAAQFGLRHRRLSHDDDTEPLVAEEIFGKLCDSGFLEPIKNSYSEVPHGCRVNPLVHWMVKQVARESGFADLNERGYPADQQPKSTVLCLTASHRERLRNLARSDESSSPKKKPGPSTTRTPPKCPLRKKRGPSRTTSQEDRQQTEYGPTRTSSKGTQHTSGQAEEQQNENDKTKHEPELLEFRNIRVILNIHAHVYRLPDCLLSYLGDHLLVLQLGQWWNYDNNTYMEVEGLEKLSAIGNLKVLRYLGIRGLSKLMELPKEVNKLQKLEVLDVRGCQNLTHVISSTIRTLRRLTHLDLNECYMLEHIGREITSLSKLQVFKGFVFGVDAPWRNMVHWQDRHVCRLQDITTKMKNLQKLNINVTTDANVNNNEMALLQHLQNLQSLTITWGELPSILTSKERSEDKDQLIKKWTGLKLPPSLVKLDVRCYPTEKIPLEWFDKISQIKSTKFKKLYVRGGAVQTLELPEGNYIEILRLRYLKEFKMQWDEMLHTMKNLRYVEVVYKDAKVMKSEKRKHQIDNELQPHMVKQEEKLMEDIKKTMGIPEFTLDEQGVWKRDQKKVDKNKKEEGCKSDRDGSKDVPESTQTQRKVPQKDGHAIVATTNDDVTDVSSDIKIF